MSIGHFPTPHPEELFYSACARFQDRVQYRDKRFIGQELFGENVVAVADLPARLGQFAASLPHGHDLTVDRIIEEHTLFPLFRPFLPPLRAKSVRDGMAGDNALSVKLGSGSAGKRIHMADWLRFCPSCVEEDVSLFREPYWHRLHQVPGIVVCPVHFIFLEDSVARMRFRVNNFDYVSAERSIQPTQSRMLDLSNRTHQALLQVARDAEWLLNQRGLCPGFADLRRRYVHAFFVSRFCTYTGVMNKDRLVEGLKSYYGPELLHLLQCEISEEALSNWSSVFMKDLVKGKVHHPLRHLLIIQFLGHTAESFFRMDAEYTPFGKGPWPCLNPVCSDYRNMVITECELTFSHSRHRRNTIGVFGCKCGFVYSRIGPDATDEDKFRYRRIKTHGTKWDAALRDLWNDSDLLLEELSLILYGKRRRDYKVKVEAERLGLSFPRKIKNFRAAQRFKGQSRASGNPDNIEANHSERAMPEGYRAEWLEALSQNPNTPRTLLRDKFSRIYKWLFRYDKEWLKSHLPPPKNHSFNWTGLDVRLAEEVREAANCLFENPIPTRVTIFALGRHTGKYDQLRRELDRLPLTAAVLREVLETPTNFAERLRGQVSNSFRVDLAHPSSPESLEARGNMR